VLLSPSKERGEISLWIIGAWLAKLTAVKASCSADGGMLVSPSWVFHDEEE
jgi:hypothetical protein